MPSAKIIIQYSVLIIIIDFQFKVVNRSYKKNYEATQLYDIEGF